MSTQVTEVEPLLVSLGETGALLGVKRTTTDGLVKNGELKTVKIGARTLVTVDSIREFVERRAAENTAA